MQPSSKNEKKIRIVKRSDPLPFGGYSGNNDETSSSDMETVLLLEENEGYANPVALAASSTALAASSTAFTDTNPQTLPTNGPFYNSKPDSLSPVALEKSPVDLLRAGKWKDINVYKIDKYGQSLVDSRLLIEGLLSLKNYLTDIEHYDHNKVTYMGDWEKAEDLDEQSDFYHRLLAAIVGQEERYITRRMMRARKQAYKDKRKIRKKEKLEKEKELTRKESEIEKREVEIERRLVELKKKVNIIKREKELVEEEVEKKETEIERNLEEIREINATTKKLEERIEKREKEVAYYCNRETCSNCLSL